MQIIFRYRKVIGFTLLVSTFLLCLPQSPAQSAMITTEYLIHQDAEQLSDRERVKAFLRRADVKAQMQAHGISPEEALSRVDSLTDNEVALIADRMEQLPAGGATFTADGSFLMFLGIALYLIFAAILLWFSFGDDKDKEKEKKSE